MKLIVCCLCAIISLLTGNAATIWYVTKSGKDTNTGKSETEALLTIQKAIDKSVAGDTILVSKGTYTYIVVPADKVPLTIRAVDSVGESVIKGDLNMYKRCATLGTLATTNIVLEGFTLTGGSVNSSCEERAGGGVAYGTVNNCVITGNKAGSICTAAGAFRCTLNNCTISDNVCSDWAGGIDGCIARGCTIKNNSGYQTAGGAQSSILTNCLLSGNQSNYGAGGCGDSTLFSCVVENNKSTNVEHPTELTACTAYGCLIVGGAGNTVQRRITWSKLYNCTVVELDSKTSHASIAGEFYNCIVYVASGSYPWYFWSKDSSKPLLRNCCVNRGWFDESTTSSLIQKSPGFVSASNYRLQSSSPCIDKGNNLFAMGVSVDLDGNPRIENGIVDIGAYEYQLPKAEVTTVEARIRYPWNGKVDLKFAIIGTSGTWYDTSFTAKDVAGGTNLTMKTLTKSDGTAANVAKEQLLPGTYNWVWDATADLGEDTVLDRVTISIKVQ